MRMLSSADRGEALARGRMTRYVLGAQALSQINGGPPGPI